MTRNRLGVLYNTDKLPGRDFLAYIQRLDEMRFDTVWLPELFSRDPFAAAGFLLAKTKHINIATGIANIYARDAAATVAAATTLQDLSEQRFILGLGVSNPGLNEIRGHRWMPPAQKLTNYLKAMQAVTLTIPRASFEISVAAHGPKMLEVAATLADGVNTYLMPAAHARDARKTLPAHATLNTMMFCLNEAKPDKARNIARKALTYYVGLDYYHRVWRAYGFNSQDFERGGSDRLIDALVAWGDIDAIQKRINQQYECGADRVVILPIGAGLGGQPDWELLTRLIEGA